MSLTTLKDDLLQEFREERIMISEQIEILDPLATSLRKPAAQRLLSSGTLIITEASCYIVSAGGIAFIAMMHKIYPFSILGNIFYNSELRNKIGTSDMYMLILAMYALAAIGVIFIFVIGRMSREIRLKNDILHQAGKDIKTIVGQHLERKAMHDTIEQRHMLGVSGISQPMKPQQPAQAAMPAKEGQPVRKVGVNELLNPGY